MRLQQLEKKLVLPSRVLEERSQELAAMKLVWKATSQSVSGRDVPASFRALVRSTELQIDQTSSLLGRSRPVLLTAQNRVSQQQIAVDVLLDDRDARSDCDDPSVLQRVSSSSLTPRRSPTGP